MIPNRTMQLLAIGYWFCSLGTMSADQLKVVNLTPVDVYVAAAQVDTSKTFGQALAKTVSINGKKVTEIPAYTIRVGSYTMVTRPDRQSGTDTKLLYSTDEGRLKEALAAGIMTTTTVESFQIGQIGKKTLLIVVKNTTKGFDPEVGLEDNDLTVSTDTKLLSNKTFKEAKSPLKGAATGSVPGKSKYEGFDAETFAPHAAQATYDHLKKLVAPYWDQKEDEFDTRKLQKLNVPDLAKLCAQVEKVLGIERDKWMDYEHRTLDFGATDVTSAERTKQKVISKNIFSKIIQPLWLMGYHPGQMIILGKYKNEVSDITGMNYTKLSPADLKKLLVKMDKWTEKVHLKVSFSKVLHDHSHTIDFKDLLGREWEESAQDYIFALYRVYRDVDAILEREGLSRVKAAFQAQKLKLVVDWDERRDELNPFKLQKLSHATVSRLNSDVMAYKASLLKVDTSGFTPEQIEQYQQIVRDVELKMVLPFAILAKNVGKLILLPVDIAEAKKILNEETSVQQIDIWVAKIGLKPSFQDLVQPCLSDTTKCIGLADKALKSFEPYGAVELDATWKSPIHWLNTLFADYTTTVILQAQQ